VQVQIYSDVAQEITKKKNWDISVKVEENGYYWNKIPILKKRATIKSAKSGVVELFWFNR